jgi:hypothetical protein
VRASFSLVLRNVLFVNNFFFLKELFVFLGGKFQVLVEGRAKSRAAILNRPASRNALTIPMVCSRFLCLFCLLVSIL